MNYILFICIATPLLLMLIPIDKNSRKVICSILCGIFGCLFISEVNGFVFKTFNFSPKFFTTIITPVSEEIIKAIPTILFLIIYPNNRKNIITVAFSVGVGFAILENLILLTQIIETVSIQFAITRGVCSGLMHSICTIMNCYFLLFAIKHNKKLIIGIIGALILAISYHATFNYLVQSPCTTLNYIGLSLPIITYLPLIKRFINEKET